MKPRNHKGTPRRADGDRSEYTCVEHQVIEKLEVCHKSGFEHGTTRGWVTFKCRCDECREAYRVYIEDYRERRRANGGLPVALGLGKMSMRTLLQVQDQVQQELLKRADSKPAKKAKSAKPKPAKKPVKKEPFDYKDWYQKNKARLLEDRAKRYQEDASYRGAAKERARLQRYPELKSSK